MNLVLEIERLLHNLEKEKEKCNEELLHMPEGHLISTVRDGKTTYFNVVSADKKYKRISVTNNKEMQRLLARKKYLEMQRDRIEYEVKQLTEVRCRLEQRENGNLLEKLPRAYCKLPDEYFFPERDDWEVQPFKQSTYKPEKKIHVTSRFLKVRSKSELLIAEKLYDHNVPFRYEEVISYNGKDFAPDFTIRRADGKIMYWEHCGMTADEGYVSYNRWKLSQYEKIGIVPWDNLIVTYDTEDGILNMPHIESEIVNKLLE